LYRNISTASKSQALRNFAAEILLRRYQQKIGPLNPSRIWSTSEVLGAIRDLVAGVFDQELRIYALVKPRMSMWMKSLTNVKLVTDSTICQGLKHATVGVLIGDFRLQVRVT